MQNERKGNSNIAAIDGLRAVAVSAILLYHVDKTWLPGGFIGVDIFYVISGFVVALSVASFRSDSLTAYIAWFYKRRIARIYPALILLVMVGLTFWALFIPDSSRIFDVPLTGYTAILGISNIFLFATANDYFGTDAEYNIFTHTWSLGVEEQYYLIFPFLSFVLLVSPAVADRRRISTDGLVLAGAVASLAICAWTTRTNYNFAFYMIFARFWELALGFVLANLLVRPRGAGLFGRASLPQLGGATAMIAALVLAYAVVSARETAFPFPDAVLPCLATGLLLVAAYQGGGSIDRLLALPLVVWVGRISYSLYLWHWPVIVAMRWTVGLAGLPLKSAAIAASVALAAFSYYRVERPIRHARSVLEASNARFFASVGVVFLVATGLAGLLYVAKPVLSLSATADPQVWRENAIPAFGAGACSAVRHRESYGSGVRYVFSPRDCPRAETTLYVLGDSHAGAYQRDFYRLASDERLRVELYTAPGCRPLKLPDDQLPAYCPRFIAESAAAILGSARAGDVLFLPGLYVHRFRESAEESEVENADLDLAVSASDAAAADEGSAFVRRFIDKGMRIVIEAPKPVLRTPLFRCADWLTRSHPDCRREPPGRDYLLTRRARALANLQAVADRSPAIRLWDPFSLLCPDEACTGYVDGKPVFFDADHLSGYGDDVVYASLRAALTRRTVP